MLVQAISIAISGCSVGWWCDVKSHYVQKHVKRQALIYSATSLSYPASALAINASAQRFKLPVRATGKTTLHELCERDPFLSHLWMPPLCLQELKVKAGATSTFSGPVISLQALAPKKCLISTSVPAEEGMGHGIFPVAESPHYTLPAKTPVGKLPVAKSTSLRLRTGSGKISCSLKRKQHIFYLALCCQIWGHQWAQANDWEHRVLKAAPRSAYPRSTIPEVGTTFRISQESPIPLQLIFPELIFFSLYIPEVVRPS